MQNCNHEEADTGVVVHILHALMQGRKTIQVRTVDTDVVVILAGTFHDLIASQLLADIWVAFGMERISGFITSTPSVQAWVSYNHEHYLCSTHFQVAIQPLPSTERARNQLGRPGRSI